MALSTGARLGPYEILSALGAGGMGEVYKARDTRLDRTVAIKILPQALAADPQFRDRFDREARTISQLDHPHICALHDVGEHDGTAYLVMQYLEGQTLADRLKKGALPLDQALQVAIQIADALATAHKAGIVHRDLKPGNIMLTKAGAKLLDFGLAKTGASALGGTHLSMLPTTPPITQQGSILGTFQYMAPEQLEGHEADARTDLFACACVVYEMVTGKKAFEGTTHASLIGAILKDEPTPVSRLNLLASPSLDHVIRRGLSKNPDDRWQTARDLKAELTWIAEGAQTSVVLATGKRARRLAWGFAALGLVWGLVATAVYLRDTPPPTALTRFVVPPPPGWSIAPGPAAPQIALSPDGRLLAFAAVTPDGAGRLWLRPLDSLDAQPLPDTEGATFPFWSPDGREIGFFAQGKLKKMRLTGGAPETITDTMQANGGTWNRQGIIVFAPSGDGGLFRVSAAGGPITPITALDEARQETAHLWPQFLPDGRHVLFLAESDQRENRALYLASLDGEMPVRLMDAEVRAQYAPPDHLLFVRGGTLMTRALSLRTSTLGGDPVQIAEHVAANADTGRTTFSVSENDTLAYRAGSVGGVPRAQLTWFDRTGKPLRTVAAPETYWIPELSPRGSHVAVTRRDPESGKDDIRLVDVSTGAASRFTFDPSTSSRQPIWSPGGERIVFASDRGGHFELYQKPASGAGPEVPLLRSSGASWPTDWSSDGQFILYETHAPKTGVDLWVLPLFGDRKPRPFLQSKFLESDGRFSPDGRWVAYTSNETGITEVYVEPFQSRGGKWQISTGGGAFPRWRPDGKELFYFADRKLMAVSVTGGDTFQAGTPKALFEARIFIPAESQRGTFFTQFTKICSYAVAADGQRFLINIIEDAAPAPITVVLNWEAALKK